MVECVQYYSHHARELKETQQHKIGKFLEHGCIEYSGGGVFLCKPIPNYNTRTYAIVRGADGVFSCNCQGFQTSLKKFGRGSCSHVGALYEYFARKSGVADL